MRFLISCVSVLTAVAMLEPALAADQPARPRPERAAPERAAPQQRAANWNGGQVGGSNGASSVNNNFVEPGAYNFFDCFSGCYETPFSFSGSKTSYIIGGFVGYRVQVGNWVVGVEGDINWQNGETSHAQNTPPPWLAYEQFTGSIKQGVDGSFRGRIGGLITPWTLLYVTGGLAVGSVSGSFSYTGCDFSPCSSGSVVSGAANWTKTLVGGTVGAGLESELFPGWKGRIEYRYTDYGKFSEDVPLTNNVFGGCSSGSGPGSCGSNAHIDMRASNHRVMVGLGLDLN